MTEPHLIIIGGGIAGLSSAYYAIKQSKAQGRTLRVTVLESSAHWGGKIVTDRVTLDGGQFVVEGGPDTFLATKPWGVALCRELGLEGRLHGTNPHKKNTYVLHRNQLKLLPDGLAMMIPTNVQAILKTRLISWPGKARMGLDFILPPVPPNGDESLGAFVGRRLGREAYENLIEPLMSGIYAGDGDALSLASTFPYLRDLELKYGSLARGALKMRQQAAGKATVGSRSAFLTPETGLGEIIEALVADLEQNQVDLRLQSPVARVYQEGAGFGVVLESSAVLHADHLILATPAYVSGALVGSVDPELATLLNSIPYVSTATVSLAYRQSQLPHTLEGYGYVIPRREGRRALACTWTSTKFPHRAPEGTALVRVFVGRAGQQDVMPRDAGQLIALAREELQLTLGIEAEPLFSRVFVWENSMPQYNLGHPEKLAQIARRLERLPGLALAGNGYRGIGIPDCIRSGETAATSVLALKDKQGAVQ